MSSPRPRRRLTRDSASHARSASENMQEALRSASPPEIVLQPH